MAGLIKAALPVQKVIGINVLKGYDNLIKDIEDVEIYSLSEIKRKNIF